MQTSVGSRRSESLRRLLLALVGVLALVVPAGPAIAASPGVHVPRDEGPHNAPDEWWYFSGHLTGVDKAGRQHTYGFEYVTFQYVGIAPLPVYIGHVAVTDLTRGTFQYAVAEDTAPLPSSTHRFALHTGAWSMKGHNGHDVLRAGLPGYQLDLRLKRTKPAALHGNRGIIDYGPFGSSAYYSWTSLATRGTLIDHGTRIRVTGMSWMDHQWGAFNTASGGGWDWFSVQLTNSQEYMVYLIRDRSGAVVRTAATRVDADGTSHVLSPNGIREVATGSWRSPVTGITYGSGWHVTLPNGTLTVTPDLVNQEVDVRRIQGVAYWEGDSTVTGTLDGASVSGVGYVEINPPAAP